MNYILIQNDGEIEINSFALIGASTKRGESGKIGFFGSGLKYSIAYMLRNNIQFRIFSGTQEVLFTTQPATIKDKKFDTICINGQTTSFTITMGPTWTEDWFVLREIYCNALDESGCQIVKQTSTVSPSEGKTRIYIEQTEKLKHVCNNWDRYFSDERTPIFVAENIYTGALGTGDGSCNQYQSIKVYGQTESILYRRGIRVNKSSDYLYDYELQHININEDRTASDFWWFHYGICDMAAQLVNEQWVRSILDYGTQDNIVSPAEYDCLRDISANTSFSDRWITFSKVNLLVMDSVSGKYVTEIQQSKNPVYFIPAIFAKKMKQKFPDISILGCGRMSGKLSFEIVDLQPKWKYLLDEVVKSLEEMGYQVNYPVSAASFEDVNIMGTIDEKSKEIIVAGSTFDKGKREIALTIMEENEHLKSGKGDETRAFETHIFSQWLKYMEDKNALFL